MKNKYDLFNEMKINDNYKINKLSNEEKDSIFNNLIKQVKIDKKTKTKSYKKVAIASFLVLSISTFLLTNKKVWALVENIGKQIESYLGKEENEYKGYKVQVNQDVEDKGIKLTLGEVLLDDGKVLLSMNIDHSNFDESKLKKGLFLNKIFYLGEASVYMDGKKFVETGGQTRNEREKDKKQDFLTTLDLNRVDTNDDGRSDITNYHILENLNPDKDYNIKVVFDEVRIHKVGLIPRIIDDEFEFIKGNWSFEFEVNGKKIAGETKVFNINKEIAIDDENFKALVNIKQLRVSPISVRLTYTVKSDKEYKNRDLHIELLDQNGEFINVGGGGSGDGTYMEYELEGNLENKQELKSIKILPYQYYTEKNSSNPKYHHRIEYEDKAINIDLGK